METTAVGTHSSLPPTQYLCLITAPNRNTQQASLKWPVYYHHMRGTATQFRVDSFGVRHDDALPKNDLQRRKVS